MFKTILLCADGSDHALKAAEVAAEIAKRFDSRCILLNVFTHHNDPVFLGMEAVPMYLESVPEAAARTQEAVERRAGKVLEAAGIKYDCVREQGHAVDRIVHVANERKVDLIVMGSRGLGGFTRFVLGSISDGVLHHAHCPVMIVR